MGRGSFVFGLVPFLVGTSLYKLFMWVVLLMEALLSYFSGFTIAFERSFIIVYVCNWTNLGACKLVDHLKANWSTSSCGEFLLKAGVSSGNEWNPPPSCSQHTFL